MWKGLLVFGLLVQFNILSSQPIANNDENVRQFRQSASGDCCPCPKNTGSTLTDFTARDYQASASDFLSRPVLAEECSCKSRSTDSEAAPSILSPSPVHAVRPDIRLEDSKDDPKPLLHPEVDLASSVLETLREATEEEYRNALARDAAKSAVGTIDPITSMEGDSSPQESGRNILTIIVNPGTHHKNDIISEESHIQEPRCIHSLESSRFNNLRQISTPLPLNEILGLPTESRDIFRENLSDTDSSVGASNIQEQVVDNMNKELQDLNLRSNPSLANLFPDTKYSQPPKPLKLKIEFRDKNRDIMLKSSDNECKQLSNSLNSTKIPKIKINSVFDKLKERLSQDSLNDQISKKYKWPMIPRVKFGIPYDSKFGHNTNLKDFHLPHNNIQGETINISKNIPKSNEFDVESKLSPIGQSIITKDSIKLKNLLDLKVTSGNKGKVKDTIIQKKLDKVRTFLNSNDNEMNTFSDKNTSIKNSKIESINNNDKNSNEFENDNLDAKPGANVITTIPKQNVTHTEILDTLPSFSEPIHNLNDDNSYGSNEEENTSETVTQLNPNNENSSKLNWHKDSVMNSSETRPNVINRNCLDKTIKPRQQIMNTEILNALPKPVTDMNEADVDSEIINLNNNINEHSENIQESEEISINDGFFTEAQGNQLIPSEGKPFIIDVVDDETGQIIQLSVEEEELKSQDNTNPNNPTTSNVAQLFLHSSSENNDFDNMEQIPKSVGSISNRNVQTVLKNNETDHTDNFKERVLNKLDVLQKNNEIILNKLSSNKLKMRSSDISDSKDSKESLNHSKNLDVEWLTTPEPVVSESESSRDVSKETSQVTYEDLQKLSDSFLDSSSINERKVLSSDSIQCKISNESKSRSEALIMGVLENGVPYKEINVESTTTASINSSPTQGAVEVRDDVTDYDEITNDSKNTSNVNDDSNDERSMQENGSEMNTELDNVKSQLCPIIATEKTLFNKNSLKEMNVEASDRVLNALPQFDTKGNEDSVLKQAIIVQPSSLVDGLGGLDLNPITPITDVRNLFHINTQLPSLEDIKSKISQLLGTSQRNAAKEDIVDESSQTDTMTDTSISNYRTTLPKLKQLENVNLDIFQLNPLQPQSRIPALNLNSYKAKLAVPKSLDLKPLKLETSLGNKDKILGASLTFGDDRKGLLRQVSPRSKTKLVSKSKVPDVVENSLDRLKNKMRSNIHSKGTRLDEFPALAFSKPLNTLSDNLKIQTEDTMRNIREMLDSTTKQAGMKGTPRTDLLQLISGSHDNIKDKIQSLRSDLNDRITALHEDIIHHDQSKLLTIGNPVLKRNELPVRQKVQSGNNIQSFVSQPMQRSFSDRREIQKLNVSDKPRLLKLEAGKSAYIDQSSFQKPKPGTDFKKLNISNQRTNTKGRQSKITVTENPSIKTSTLRKPLKKNTQLLGNIPLTTTTFRTTAVSIPTLKNKKMPIFSKSSENGPTMYRSNMLLNNDDFKMRTRLDSNNLPSEMLFSKISAPVSHDRSNIDILNTDNSFLTGNPKTLSTKLKSPLTSKVEQMKVRTTSSQIIGTEIPNRSRFVPARINIEDFSVRSLSENVDESSTLKAPLIPENVQTKISNYPLNVPFSNNRRSSAKIAITNDVDYIPLKTTKGPTSVNTGTISTESRNSIFQEKLGWPKITDDSFLSKVREAVKARLSEIGRQPIKNRDMLRSASNLDLTQSPSDNNIETAVSPVDETIKENITYKCKMVCVRD